MSFADLGALGEFVGAVAVLMTLIYLAVQTKQNKDATRQLYILNKSDQRIRGLWTDRDSPYLARIFAKARRHEPLDDEDIFRIENTIQVEFVRLRVSHGQREHLAPHLNGVNFGALRRFIDVFPEQVYVHWRRYVDSISPPAEFVEWVEKELPSLRKRAA